MRYVVPAGSVMALVLPAFSSRWFKKAAVLLQQAFHQRLDLSCFTVSQAEWVANRFGLSIHLNTLDTLAPEWQSRFDPPLSLLPYPDYAEHIAVRTVEAETTPVVFVVTGSEKALIGGAGALLRHFRFYADRMEFSRLQVDCRPLTPLRGVFFANRADSHSYFNFTDAQWEALLTDHALWGNNLAGCIPVHFPDWPGTAPWPEPGEFASAESRIMWEAHWRTQQAFCKHAAALGLSPAAWMPLHTAFPAMIPPELGDPRAGILDLAQTEARSLAAQLHEALLLNLPQVERIWLSPVLDPVSTSPTASHSPNIVLDMALRLRESFEQHGRSLEIWLGTSGYGEEPLDALFTRLAHVTSSAIRALICDPEDPSFVQIRREMPLPIQLLTAMPLSSAVKRIQSLVSFDPEGEYVFSGDVPVILPRAWAERFFSSAPLTYGALGISSGSHDEFVRFLWAALSWLPQPELDEIMEQYGHWYFGAEAAPCIRDALAALEAAWSPPQPQNREKAEEALARLDQAESRVPPRMRGLAEFRMQLLRIRALLDLALYDKSLADAQLVNRLRDLASCHASEISHGRICQDLLKWVNHFPDESLAARFHELGELRRALFRSHNLHVQAVDRIWNPSRLRRALAARLQAALRSPAPGEPQAFWEELRRGLPSGGEEPGNDRSSAGSQA